MTDKATRDELGALHNKIAQSLVDNLYDEEGRLDIKVVTQAIKFLKDNGIEVDVEANGGAILHLVDEMPFTDEEHAVGG